ncbi:MAG: leucine-rich repeat protein [Verrucomicrobiota bacterium]
MSTIPNRIASVFQQLRHASVAYLLPLLMSLAISARVHALDFTYTISNNTVTITGYTGSGGAVTIPATINGLPVTSIGYSAFYNNKDILTSVTIPASVSSIGDSAFDYCTSLTAITVDVTNSTYASLAGVLFDKSLTTLIQCPNGKTGIYAIASSVTSIGDRAFYYCTGLTSVTIPAGVTSIGSHAFQFCSKLTSASFMSKAPTMGSSVFSYVASGFIVYYYNGRNFTSPTWNGYTSVGQAAPIIALEQPAGTAVAVGGVSNFGTYAMGDFTSKVFTLRNTGDAALTGITITQDGSNSGDFTVGAPGATTIAPGASTTFSVTYAPTATGTRIAAIHIASNSPDKNPYNINLTGTGTPTPPFTFTSSGSAITITGYTGSGGNAVVPATMAGLPVTTIAANAFLNNTLLTGVSIPASVTSIGNSAFSGCSGLTGVYFLGSVPSLGTTVFLGDTTALAYYLPSVSGWGATVGGLTTVPVSYTSTTSNGAIAITGYTGSGGVVSVPAMINAQPVTSIGSWAFARCATVTSVVIPNGVTSIGDHAFYQCSGMTGVTLPASLTSIGDDAFFLLGGLASVTIPAGVTSIGVQAFAGCGGLTAISVDAANASYSSLNGVLFNKAQSLLIQYPAGKSIPYTVPPGVTNIGDFAFYNCLGLTGVTFPAGLLSIGNGAFESCGAITSITLPAGMTRIGDQAFSGCGGLTSLSLPDSITYIGDMAFASCVGLSRVTLPASLTSIGMMAFASCSGLTSVTIPATVKQIGSYAFYGDGNLVRAYFLGNAPAMGYSAFDSAASGFTVSFHSSVTGFTTPAWAGYQAVNADTASLFTNWLLAHNLPIDADPLSDPNGDGVSLVMAYALNLDPNLNLSGSMPKSLIVGNQLRLTYYAGNPDVSYTVEASSDLQSWSAGNVILTALDANHLRTATVTITGSPRFLRLGVAY